MSEFHPVVFAIWVNLFVFARNSNLLPHGERRRTLLAMLHSRFRKKLLSIALIMAAFALPATTLRASSRPYAFRNHIQHWSRFATSAHTRANDPLHANSIFDSTDSNMKKKNCWADGLMPTSPRLPDRTLKQLTASPCTPLPFDFGDPSSPRLTQDHTLLIYGSGKLSWTGSSDQEAWNHFLAADPPGFAEIPLYHPDGTQLEGPKGDEEAWDVTVETFAIPDSKTGDVSTESILFGGVMTPPTGEKNAHFDDDNLNRRTYAFRQQNGLWVRDQNPLNTLFPATGWMGHNYGHQFITADDGSQWMFYERVSDVVADGPFKTEMFARHFQPPAKLVGPEIQIFKIPEPPYPAVVRESGSLLVEGPRPFAISLGGQTFYLVSFSSSDWGSEHYGINLLWSRKIEGPYKPILNSRGDDLKDFGEDIRKKHDLTYGPGRGTFFQDPQGRWWVIFHAAKLQAVNESHREKERDHDRGTSRDDEEQDSTLRNFFLAPVEIKLINGEPQVEILEKDLS